MVICEGMVYVLFRFGCTVEVLSRSFERILKCESRAPLPRRGTLYHPGEEREQELPTDVKCFRLLTCMPSGRYER